MKRNAYSYSCVMARLPEQLASKVRAISEKIPDDLIYDEGSGEQGREDKPHTTVKYGLHTEDPYEVAKVIGYFGPVAGELRKMSAFVNDSVVLKMGVQSQAMQALNRLICRELENTDTFPEYKPHVTVAYIKKGPDDDPYYFTKMYSDALEGEVFEIDKVEFSTPAGKKYWISLIDGAVTEVEPGRTSSIRMMARRKRSTMRRAQEELDEW